MTVQMGDQFARRGSLVALVALVALGLRGLTHSPSPILVSCLGRIDAVGDLTVDGSVSVLDAQTGALLRTVSVGAGPDAMAVDERNQRAFVANSNINYDYTPAQVHPHEEGWRQELAWLHDHLPWLPLPAFRQQAPIAGGSVTVLDTSRL